MLRTTAVLLGLAVCAPAQDVGKPFPVKTYPLLAAAAAKPELTSLAQFRGKKVLLIQFASW